MKSEVFIVKCANYNQALPKALSHLLELTTWFKDKDLHGKNVLLKPNLLTDRLPEQAVTTHPELVRQVIRHLKALGANVTVGDSPASVANLHKVWESSGVQAVCADEQVPLISFEQAGSTQFERDGFTFSIANPILKADLIINLPKIKSHSLTILTAAVKNMYGAIPGYAKTRFHGCYPKPTVFGQLIKTIWQVFPHTLTIADAVVGMDGPGGPANGRPVYLGFLAAAENPFALDRVLCDILHVDPRRVPYLTTAIPSHDKTEPIIRIGDQVTVNTFITPSGTHLLNLLPDWLIRYANRILWVRPFFSNRRCSMCGMCEQACPVQAITLKPITNQPVLKARVCISCSCCHEICPNDAIRMTQSRFLRMLNLFKGLD